LTIQQSTDSTVPDPGDLLVIDAGVGNLGNLVRALEHLGERTHITRDPATLAAGRRLVLPGVGAFKPPREALRGALEEALRAALEEGAWLLGICVGFQLLFETGEEYGTTDGLGLLPGRITELPPDVPRPHIGWNALRGVADHALLRGIEEGDHVYFVHSFAPEGVDPTCRLAGALHGRDFTAVAGRGRVFGSQFHPEKSGEVGLRLLANFLEMSRCS
jgi:glutamine amidotransferase